MKIPIQNLLKVYFDCLNKYGTKTRVTIIAHNFKRIN